MTAFVVLTIHDFWGARQDDSERRTACLMDRTSAVLRGSGALSFFARQLVSIARRWHAAAVWIHQIDATQEKIDDVTLLEEWVDPRQTGHGLEEALDRHVVDVQWRRLSQHKASSFEGPSFHRAHGQLVLRYVARADMDAMLSIIFVVGDAASDAAGCSGEIDRFLLASAPPAEADYVTLSRRELQVAHWSAEGKTSQEIAVILGLSEHSVNQYIRSGMRKTKATNRLNFVATVIRLGLVG